MNPPTDIPSWLESLGLAALAPVFEENHITPDVLHQMTGEDFREMGITSLGHRKKLLAAVAALNAPVVRVETAAPAAPPEKPQPNPAAKPPRHERTIKLRPAAVTVSAAPVPAPAAQPAAQPAAMPPDDPPRIEARPARGGAGHKRKAFSGAFMIASILLHLTLGLGAGYWVVQKLETKRKLQFAGGPPTTSPSKRALEHKVSLQKKRNAGGSPAQARRIAVSGLASKITLPDMPAVPTTSTQFVAGRMAGMGGAGFGTGLGFGNGSGMGVGGMGGGGLGLTMFGARGGAGLTGTFYDLKRDRNGSPNGVRPGNRPHYTKVLKGFTSGNVWRMPSGVSCYTGKSNLVAKAFLFPAIPDEEAGKAFNEPATGPGMWIAHYTGTVKPPVSGRFRFVGWGDNLLAVRLGNKVVLDASDIGYLKSGDNRHDRGSVSFPNKGATPMLAGSWFDVTAGSSLKMDVILGDEGGIYCAGLLLEREGDRSSTGKHKIPELPLFLAAPLNLAERNLYDKHLSSKALSGPVFSAAPGDGGPLDAIRR